MRSRVDPCANPKIGPARGTGYLAFLAMMVGAFSFAGLATAGDTLAVPEPEGYRLEDFRAPVPETLAGATVLDTEQLRRMLERDGDIVLIDVLPAPRRPEGLRPDALWLPRQRRNIPGSVWLPNTGYGVLPVEEEHYLRRNLRRLTGGDTTRPVVFYCLADCWMSWNAGKRAISWGYESVHWYPDGTDGWEDAGLPLEESVPVPRNGG